ncbi:MAG TPA: tetratricopeptide repeat protein [Aliiroseovarius sp.]|nr:tetratricopeptide repeat protein [Aliiroseovarius sp.]
MALPLLLWLLTAAPVTADGLSACIDGTDNRQTRLAACAAALADIADAPAPRQLEFYTAYGDLLVSEDRDAEAVEMLGRALALDPDQPRALLRRAVALTTLGRNQDALADLTRLTALTPDDDFALYRLGVTLDNLRRYTEALEVLDRALALDPDYFWSHFERARALEGLERWQEAGQAARAALALEPLNQAAHLRAFRAFDAAGAADKAAYHARVLTVLDPNRLDQQAWLDEYVARSRPDFPPAAAPVPWQPLPEAREIRYLQVISDDFQRDQVAEAISWFATAITYPTPDRALVFRQRFTTGARENLIPLRTTEAVEGAKAPPERGPPLWRGILPLDRISPRPGPPDVVPDWGDTRPAQAWPLTDGTRLSGRARYLALCATGSGMRLLLMGCRPGVETVELGSFDWTLEVAREPVHVPAGWFDTYRLSFTQEGEVRLPGRALPVRLRAQYWLDPGLGTWVARRTDRDGRFSLTQALAVIR